MGRKAAAKTAASVLGGELMFQGTEAAKTGLNNSSLGDTKFNYSFAQPALTAMAIAVNPDDVAAKALVKRGATTINGIRRRTSAGMGRCQGAECEEAVLKILADELGITVQEVTKDGKGSSIII